MCSHCRAASAAAAADLSFDEAEPFRKHIMSEAHKDRLAEERQRLSAGKDVAPEQAARATVASADMPDFGPADSDDALSLFFHAELPGSAPEYLRKLLSQSGNGNNNNNSARGVAWRVGKAKDLGPSRRAVRRQQPEEAEADPDAIPLLLKVWRSPLEIGELQLVHPHLAECAGCAFREALLRWCGIRSELAQAPSPASRRWAVLMVQGGRFAGGVFDVYGGRQIPEIRRLDSRSLDLLEQSAVGAAPGGGGSAWDAVQDLSDDEESSDSEDEKQAELKDSPQIAVAGDLSALQMVCSPKVLLHKSFSKYVVRKKQGRVQWQADSSRSSTINSAGARIRRHNFEQFVVKLKTILAEWRESLLGCERVFLVAPSYNRQLVLAEGSPLNTPQAPPIVTVPFMVNRPTYTECCRILKRLCFLGALLPKTPAADDEPEDAAKEQLSPSGPLQRSESDRYGVKGFRSADDDTPELQANAFSLLEDLEDEAPEPQLQQEQQQQQDVDASPEIEIPTSGSAAVAAVSDNNESDNDEESANPVSAQPAIVKKKKKKNKNKNKKKNAPQPVAIMEPPVLDPLPVDHLYSCDFCAVMFSDVPFYRLDFCYCSTRCLRQHRFEVLERNP